MKRYNVSNEPKSIGSQEYAETISTRKQQNTLKKIENMPNEHPFHYATLCKDYVMNDEFVYITENGHFAYTYPTYDQENKSFNYLEYNIVDDYRIRHYSEELIDTIESAIDYDTTDWLTDMVNLFGVCQEDIDECIRQLNELYSDDM